MNNVDHKKIVSIMLFISGIRVIPEFDQPAHVTSGWQFPESENLTTCRGIEPWYDYCAEPPCGQVRRFLAVRYIYNYTEL
jgi:hypothetical protein